MQAIDLHQDIPRQRHSIATVSIQGPNNIRIRSEYSKDKMLLTTWMFQFENGLSRLPPSKSKAQEKQRAVE